MKRETVPKRVARRLMSAMRLIRFRYGVGTIGRLHLAIVLGMAAWGGDWIYAAAQSAVGANANGSTVRGVVRDPAGKPVADAAVRLERRDTETATDRTSSADGAFEFASVADGDYVVSATKAGKQSQSVEIKVSSSEGGGNSTGQESIVLELEDTLRSNKGTVASGSQPMEFSDSPSFTIAAVTDWTAAGGHGSDAILRTSESLTRDAAQLKGGVGDTRPVADPALKQAVAFEASGEYAKAREIVRTLLTKEKTGDRLRLAGELDEKLGDPVAAVNELEHAVREDGSEENYFEWGSELLLHRAIWQAKDVFTAGAKRYPRSARMLTALGAALFACSLYDDAAQRLCEAADLNPSSHDAYLFLGKAEMAAPNPLRCSQEKLAEFAKREPDNPLASYYDAMAIWKQSGRSTDVQTQQQVESLLDRAVALDPKCSDAYLQLGNLSVSRHEEAKAIADYSKAVEANPQSTEAHYRLGMAYDRVGERDKAKREFQLHEELDKQQAAEVERQRREVKQFLVKGSYADASTP
jgi:tetratricopeptide (TPR) repeat protein